MGVGPAHRTSLPTGFSEWALGHISHAWNGSPYYLLRKIYYLLATRAIYVFTNNKIKGIILKSENKNKLLLAKLDQRPFYFNK